MKSELGESRMRDMLLAQLRTSESESCSERCSCGGPTAPSLATQQAVRYPRRWNVSGACNEGIKIEKRTTTSFALPRRNAELPQVRDTVVMEVRNERWFEKTNEVGSELWITITVICTIAVGSSPRPPCSVHRPCAKLSSSGPVKLLFSR